MKWVVELILTVMFVITLGMFSFSAEFPDETEFCINGWLL
jgi:hypothetical protein